jgi:hypothetical protein
MPNAYVAGPTEEATNFTSIMIMVYDESSFISWGICAANAALIVLLLQHLVIVLKRYAKSILQIFSPTFDRIIVGFLSSVCTRFTFTRPTKWTLLSFIELLQCFLQPALTAGFS